MAEKDEERLPYCTRTVLFLRLDNATTKTNYLNPFELISLSF
jgi:hypothetical protein